MKTINRLLTNICSTNLIASKNFYTKLFDLKVDYDSDWFVHLISKDKRLELGIVDRTNGIVPKGYQTAPNGFYITFIVDNATNYSISSKPKALRFWKNPSTIIKNITK